MKSGRPRGRGVSVHSGTAVVMKPISAPPKLPMIISWACHREAGTSRAKGRS